MNENSEKLYVFQFNEEDVQKLFILLRDCIGVAYYDNLTMAFFRQYEEAADRSDPPIQYNPTAGLPLFTKNEGATNEF